MLEKGLMIFSSLLSLIPSSSWTQHEKDERLKWGDVGTKRDGGEKEERERGGWRERDVATYTASLLPSPSLLPSSFLSSSLSLSLPFSLFVLSLHLLPLSSLFSDSFCLYYSASISPSSNFQKVDNNDKCDQKDLSYPKDYYSFLCWL